MFKNFFPNILKRLNPAATIRKIKELTSAADTQRLLNSVAKGAVGGAITLALAGHSSVSALGGGAVSGAGAAFLNFIKNPTTPDSAQ